MGIRLVRRYLHLLKHATLRLVRSAFILHPILHVRQLRVELPVLIRLLGQNRQPAPPIVSELFQLPVQVHVQHRLVHLVLTVLGTMMEPHK